MQRYRGSNLIRAGVIGVILIILVIAVGLQPERLLQYATSLRYQALFSEAGGLATGNDVTVSGIKVGTVSSIELDNGDALVGFTINSKYALGPETTAHIRTGTLLGERVLALDSAGTGTLDPRQIIEIRKLIRTLAGDRTVILSTHILPEVSQICEKVVILSSGRIALEERMDSLLKKGVSLEDVFLQAIAREEEHLEDGESTPEASAPAAEEAP